MRFFISALLIFFLFPDSLFSQQLSKIAFIGQLSILHLILLITALIVVFALIRMIVILPIGPFLKGYKTLSNTDLIEFVDKLETSYEKEEYIDGIIHYYSIMGEFITAGKGKYWHFTPLWGHAHYEDAINLLHVRFVKELGIAPDMDVMEIGCGYGKNVRWLAENTKADIHGITLSPVEVEYIREFKKTDTIQNYSVSQGDYHDMNYIPDNSFDKVIAIYCIKYSNNLEKVFSEIKRVLKPGGQFLSYEILTTDKYDKANPIHAQLVENICKSTSMPPLYMVSDFISTAKEVGLDLYFNEEISEYSENGKKLDEGTWWQHFLKDGSYQLLSSKVIAGIVSLAEKTRVFKPGFRKFFDYCLVHPTTDFVKAGRMGIITGSRIMLFQKPK
jgi:ubiquinone/menaquinone biosynthesis C-methylase UbiE